MLRFLPLLLVLFAPIGGVARAADPSFIHPGLLHSREDLGRMQQAIAAKAEPIYGGFEKLRAHPASQSNYVSRGAAEEIGRNPSVNHAQFDADANAAYQCALMWCLTGDRAFAETAKNIVNAWSAQLQRVTGADAVLMAGLGPFKLINAVELLRHTDAGWSAAEVERTEAMLRRAFYPALKDFALFANGNWDTAAIKTLLAIGVFCNDRPIYERALRYYVAGAGNGRLTHYIINDAGQCQESGRDMGHTQLGLAHLGEACEIAWNQGLDLYGYADNRLLKGFEYTARYNLGEDVPFAETLDRTGKYHHKKISPIGRGALRPVFEQIYQHYVKRAGLTAPWTQQAAEKLRPEGASRPGADHTGFGTLLYARPRQIEARSLLPPSLAGPPGVTYNGNETSLESGGAGIGGGRDDYAAVLRPVSGDTTVIVHFKPPFNSQRTQFGLMIRESADADAGCVAFLVAADPSGESERPTWQARLSTRAVAGGSLVPGPERPLFAPHVTYGRLMKGFGLKLERAGQRFTASLALDDSGVTWTLLGTVEITLKSATLAGAVAASRVPRITTAVTLQGLTISQPALR